MNKMIEKKEEYKNASLLYIGGIVTNTIISTFCVWPHYSNYHITKAAKIHMSTQTCIHTFHGSHKFYT